MSIYIIIIFIIFLFLGMPIGFLLGLIGIFTLWQSNLPNALLIVPQRFFQSLNSFVFMAMPFFMLSGLLMDRIGISEKLLAFSSLLVGRVRGGIAHMNILASVFFAGLSGSGLADIAGLGSIEIPMMIKAGYDKEYSTAITVASAMIGPIIPPSIIMVVYGGAMNVSIAGLFAAGIPAGILLAFDLMIINAVISKKRNYPKRDYSYDKRTSLKIIKETIPAMGLPIIILGGILGGVVTPTEAGALAVVYALFLGFCIYRNLSLKNLISIFLSTIKMAAIVYLLIGSTAIFGWYITIAQIPNKLGEIFLLISTNPHIVIFLINIVLLIAGMFMDLTAALLVLAPIFAPIAIKLGFHPLHIGIIICFNLTLGMMTPPLGTGLFAGCIIGKVKFENLIKSIFPLLCVNILTLFIIVYFPIITMFLPKILGLY